MKFLNKLTLVVIAALALFSTSCSSDDDNPINPFLNLPPVVNEEEVITTITVTLTPTTGDAVTLKMQDLDGDGPDAPTFDVSGPLAANTDYTGSIELLNETENPAEDITEEVETEAEEHQFFYTVGTGLNVTSVAASNTDGNGNPLGTEFNLSTGDASTGNLTFTLRHEPTKPNTGLDNAGGETDIEATFDVTIQ